MMTRMGATGKTGRTSVAAWPARPEDIAVELAGVRRAGQAA